nr:phospholipase-like protein [Tanacetum cinerariifolium]
MIAIYGVTFKVDDTLFRLVEKLEAWNSFPWGEHLWSHLYDEIKNLKERHGDDHYYGLKKDHNYVPTYTLSSFVFAFHHVPRDPPIKEQHSLFETYLSKLEKARKSRNTGFMVSSIGGTSDNSVRKKWLNDLVIIELNFYVFKLETIIQHDSDEDIAQLLMQNCMPIFYANGDKYATPWSEVDQFHIHYGEVTFYDTGDTYDYDYRDWDFHLVTDTYVTCQQLTVRCQERREQIVELQTLVGSNVAAEAVRLLRELQDDDLEKAKGMMKLISETQLKNLKKISFIAKLRRQ